MSANDKKCFECGCQLPSDHIDHQCIYCRDWSCRLCGKPLIYDYNDDGIYDDEHIKNILLNTEHTCWDCEFDRYD